MWMWVLKDLRLYDSGKTDIESKFQSLEVLRHLLRTCRAVVESIYGGIRGVVCSEQIAYVLVEN